MHRRSAILLAALALAACEPGGERSPAPTPPAPMPTTQPAPPSGSAEPEPGASPPARPVIDACGAGRLGEYVNQLPSGEALARIRQAAGHSRIRVIRPGDVVTMDFSAERLNVEIGGDGRIKRLRCG